MSIFLEKRLRSISSIKESTTKRYNISYLLSDIIENSLKLYKESLVTEDKENVYVNEGVLLETERVTYNNFFLGIKESYEYLSNNVSLIFKSNYDILSSYLDSISSDIEDNYDSVEDNYNSAVDDVISIPGVNIRNGFNIMDAIDISTAYKKLIDFEINVESSIDSQFYKVLLSDVLCIADKSDVSLLDIRDIIIKNSFNRVDAKVNRIDLQELLYNLSNNSSILVNLKENENSIHKWIDSVVSELEELGEAENHITNTSNRMNIYNKYYVITEVIQSVIISLAYALVTISKMEVYEALKIFNYLKNYNKNSSRFIINSGTDDFCEYMANS